MAAAFVPLSALSAPPASTASHVGHVYVLSNDPNGNSVLVFDRKPSGAVTLSGSFATGGNGAGSGADPLGSQNPVVLSTNGHLLFAVNAGSNSITAFRVSGDQLMPVNTVSSWGTMPVSVAVQKDLAYAVNAGGTPNISGFTIDKKTGALAPLAGSTQPLPGGAGAAPAEVSFGPHEHVLVVTEQATNQIDTFALNSDGTAKPGTAFPSSERTPFGFDFGQNDVAVISNAEGGDAGAATLSSYKVAPSGNLSAITTGIGDTQTAACWVAVTQDGTFAYTSNTGGGTVSSYTVSEDGALSLLNVAAANVTVPVDLGMAHNGRFLYVRNAGDHSLSGFRIGHDGSLTQVTTVSGLPDGAAGLAAR